MTVHASGFIRDRQENADPDTRQTDRKTAGRISRAGKALLHTRENRMSLILGSVLVLVSGMTLYFILSLCVSLVSVLTDLPDILVNHVFHVLLLLLLVGVLWPLCLGLYRMAVLMSLSPDGGEVTVSDCLYPFSSGRAYGRTTVVGLELFAWGLLIFFLPVVGFLTVHPLLLREIGALFPFLPGWMAQAGSFLVCTGVAVMIGLAFLFLSGYRAGFAYLIFACPEESFFCLAQRFRNRPHPVLTVFLGRLKLVGWYALSAVGILIPFIVHALPYTLCCSAAYARLYVIPDDLFVGLTESKEKKA